MLLIGIVRVKTEKFYGPSREQVAVVGGWAGSFGGNAGGAGLGYRGETMLRMPRECRVVILVRNREEYDRLMEAIGPAIREDGQLCTASED